jgi:hypothetical protein
LQLFHALRFFAFEFHPQITESKEVKGTDVRAIGKLKSASEVATLETTFSDGWPMRCGIVKMHDASWGTCTAPAVQDMGK